MPFGTEVKISSIYNLPPQSVDGSNAYASSSSEASNSYDGPSEPHSVYNSPEVSSPELYEAPSPPSNSNSSSTSSAAGAPSATSFPLAESYVSPPGGPRDLQAYVPDEPTAPVLDPEDIRSYQSDVVFTTEKADKEENTIDRVDTKGATEEIEPKKDNLMKESTFLDDQHEIADEQEPSEESETERNDLDRPAGVNPEENEIVDS